MKNTLTILLLLGAFTVSAQLNSNAQTLKDANSIEYRLLKKYAEQKWGEDYEMIVYTINEHTDAMPMDTNQELKQEVDEVKDLPLFVD